MKKIPNWLLWDWRSIFSFAAVIAFGSLVMVSLFKFPDWIRSWRGRDLLLTTTGNYLSSKAVQQLTQGRTGNKISTAGYEITYYYSVNGKIYYGSDKIPNSLRNSKFINALFADPTQQLKIKYEPLHPDISQIIIPPY